MLNVFLVILALSVPHTHTHTHTHTRARACVCVHGSSLQINYFLNDLALIDLLSNLSIVYGLQ
jgi:hypothetical protein